MGPSVKSISGVEMENIKKSNFKIKNKFKFLKLYNYFMKI